MTWLLLISLFAFPVVFHEFSMIGRRLLVPVQTPWKQFNAFYNAHPMLLSIASGLFGASAYLSRGSEVGYYLLAGLSLIAFVIDMIGCLFSFTAYIGGDHS